MKDVRRFPAGRVHPAEGPAPTHQEHTGSNVHPPETVPSYLHPLLL